MRKTVAETIDEYIATFPLATQNLLKELRAAIHLAAPQATECISYGMPCFRSTKNLVYFAAYKNHIGFYPGANSILHFQPQLKGYAFGKGSIQFPLHTPIPVVLIDKIVQFRLKEIAIKEK